MIIAYSYLPVVEEILISRFTEYFKTIGWDDKYPKFPLRINNEFPWVPYLSSKEFYEKGWIDLSSKPGLFPSITIVNTQDVKSPTLFLDALPTNLKKTEIEQFKELAESEGSEISPKAIEAIDEYFLENDVLYGTNIVYQKRDTINIDITVDDKTNIRNRIYDYLEAFLVGHGANALKTELDIEIMKESVTGNRAGAYSVQFGRPLKGSTIQCQVDYNISQVYYDTEKGLITDIEINHTVDGG